MEIIGNIWRNRKDAQVKVAFFRGRFGRCRLKSRHFLLFDLAILASVLMVVFDNRMFLPETQKYLDINCEVAAARLQDQPGLSVRP
jgi:hypothetical protein